MGDVISMDIDVSKMDVLIKKYKDKKGFLIPLLQDVQSTYGYVPRDAIYYIAKAFNIFPATIYGVLTFYTQFFLTPRGMHTIRVCQGTACHVMGGKELLDYISNRLGIKDGETTKDGFFSLVRVACLGCCGMAPVVMIDKEVYGNCTFQKIDSFLETYISKEKK